MEKVVDFIKVFQKYLICADYATVSGNCDLFLFEFARLYRVCVMDIGGSKKFKIEISMSNCDTKSVPVFEPIQTVYRSTELEVSNILSNVKNALKNKNTITYDFTKQGKYK